MSVKTATVKSPAGDTIEILSDEEYCALAGVRPHSLGIWDTARRPVFTALWRHKFPRQSNGNFTSTLLKVAREYGYRPSAPGSLTSFFNQDCNAPAVDRDVNGRKTYEIRLTRLPRRWFDRLVFADIERAEAEAAHDNAVRDEALTAADNAASGYAHGPTAPPAPPDAPTLPAPPDMPDNGHVDDTFVDRSEWTPERIALDDERRTALAVAANGDAEALPPFAVDLEISSSVAMALLTRVVEIVSAGDTATTDRRVEALEADLAHTQRRLAEQTEATERYRRQLREAGDELAGVKSDAAGLRQRLRMAEANLERATSTDVRKFVDGMVADEVARVMRQAPTNRG